MRLWSKVWGRLEIIREKAGRREIPEARFKGTGGFSDGSIIRGSVVRQNGQRLNPDIMDMMRKQLSQGLGR
jgi:hypothetical protein